MTQEELRKICREQAEDLCCVSKEFYRKLKTLNANLILLECDETGIIRYNLPNMINDIGQHIYNKLDIDYIYTVLKNETGGKRK